MAKKVNINELKLLMNENSLSDNMKKEITRKINNLLDLLEKLSCGKDVDKSLIDNLTNIKEELEKEQKITTKMVVRKNDSLSKEYIKSLTLKKETSLQVLEVNQLRVEAELKKLKSTCPTVQASNSPISKLFSILKISFNSTNKKINSATNQLNKLENQKNNLSKEISNNGQEALKYLHNITYNSFLPSKNISKRNINELKNKITFLK